MAGKSRKGAGSRPGSSPKTLQVLPPAEPAESRPRRGPGRPRIEFDLRLVEGLGRIGATAEEMAHLLPASQSTIEHRLADPDSDFYSAYKRGQSHLKCSLRRKQVQLAEAGNVTMLIWLGKQLLRQSDRLQDTLIHISPEILDAATEAELEQIAKGRVSEQLIARLERRYFEGMRWSPAGLTANGA